MTMNCPEPRLILDKYSLGVGDRFAHQGRAQLRACVQAAELGVAIVPVWNKSNREHKIVGSQPASVREEADQAVNALAWKAPYYVDADHINLETVDRFIESSDFFTLDVADAIGRPAETGVIDAFLKAHPELTESIEIDGIEQPFRMSRAEAAAIASKYLFAVSQAGEIYRRLASTKGAAGFITEVSMDETDSPQTPFELLLILAAIAGEGIPAQTIAPKFTGRFNKGVDYKGDVEQFEREFEADIAVIAFARQRYGLPRSLKLSVHSGSDKFSIYAPMRRALRKFDAGVHLKTAGTTWLEELIGLAEAGGDGLLLAREVYALAHAHSDELCKPYATVIDIDPARLPSPEQVQQWSSEQFTAALRHDQANPLYNADLRQLLHVGYKVAAALGERYTNLLDSCEPTISRNVTENLFDRHIRPLFLG
jgi:hypothetical protein